MSQMPEGEKVPFKQVVHDALLFGGVMVSVALPLVGAYLVGESVGQDNGKQQQCTTLKQEGVVIPTATTAPTDRGRRVASVDACGQIQYEQTPAPYYPYYPLGGW